MYIMPHRYQVIKFGFFGDNQSHVEEVVFKGSLRECRSYLRDIEYEYLSAKQHIRPNTVEWDGSDKITCSKHIGYKGGKLDGPSLLDIEWINWKIKRI